MSSPAGPSGGPTNLGVAPNVAGLLSYAPCCIGLIFSIVAAIVEKQSRYVRFHAFQSLLLHGAALVVGLGLFFAQILVGLVAGPLALLVSLLQMVIGLAFLGVCIFLMVKAYNNEEYQVPTLGPMAKSWASQ